MKVHVSWKWFLIGVVVLGLSLTVACGKRNAAEQALQMAKEISQSAAPTSAQNDYTKPYLTEEKMQKFIESLKEEMNPFEVVFKGGETRTLTDLKERLEQYNAFAKKYGFADYADYMAVWGRITVGEMAMAGDEMKQKSMQWMQDSVKTAEENLKKPDLSPEMKSMYEEQLASSKKSLEEMQKPETEKPALNADDMALVKKYKAQIDEATKKLKEAQEQKNK